MISPRVLESEQAGLSDMDPTLAAPQTPLSIGVGSPPYEANSTGPPPPEPGIQGHIGGGVRTSGDVNKVWLILYIEKHK